MQRKWIVARSHSFPSAKHLPENRREGRIRSALSNGIPIHCSAARDAEKFAHLSPDCFDPVVLGALAADHADPGTPARQGAEIRAKVRRPAGVQTKRQPITPDRHRKDRSISNGHRPDPRPFAAALALAALLPAAPLVAQGVDFMNTFNAANRAAVETGRTTALGGTRPGSPSSPRVWPAFDEAHVEARVFTLHELKDMAFVDRWRASALLEGRVIIVEGIAGRRTRAGTAMSLTAPDAPYAVRGEWSQAAAIPTEGTPLRLRGRVRQVAASMLYMDSPEILP